MKNNYTTPLVSIIIPSFNRAHLIGETLDSVLAQTYKYWECIIVDDGSTDNSEDVIQKYVELDSRIKFSNRQREPKGGSACRNIGVEKSKGQFVIFLDADDLLAPYCLEQRVVVFCKNIDKDFIVFQTYDFESIIGDSQVCWNVFSGKNDLNRFLSKDVVWQTTSPIWKKKSILNLNGFTEYLDTWQDWELHVRALAEGMSYIKVDTVPDNFWRTYRKQENKTIKSEKFQIQHIKFVNELFHHYTNKFYGTDRYHLLWGLVFLLAIRWASDFQRRNKSINLWKEMQSNYGLRLDYYLLGLLCLFFTKRSGGALVFRLASIYNKSIFNSIDRSTMHSIKDAKFTAKYYKKYCSNFNVEFKV